MKLFDNLFKRRETLISYEDINVLIKTDKALTEKQKGTIICIVKEGVRIGASLDYMKNAIIMEAAVYTPVILNKIPNGIEVII